MLRCLGGVGAKHLPIGRKAPDPSPRPGRGTRHIGCGCGDDQRSPTGFGVELLVWSLDRRGSVLRQRCRAPHPPGYLHRDRAAFPPVLGGLGLCQWSRGADLRLWSLASKALGRLCRGRSLARPLARKSARRHHDPARSCCDNQGAHVVPTSSSDPIDLVCLAIGSNESREISNNPSMTSWGAGST